MSDGQEPTQPIKDDPPLTTPPEPKTEPEPATPKTFDESYVKELRAEAAKNRKAAKDAKKALDEIRQTQEAADAKKLEEQGEWQKLAEQNATKVKEAEAKLAEQDVALKAERRSALAISIATQLGAIDPTDANFQSAVGAIDIAADDAETKIRQALEALKVARPYLFGTGKPNLASFNPATGSTEPTAETPTERRQRIYGGGASKVFDAKAAEKRGGGVIYTQKTE